MLTNYEGGNVDLRVPYLGYSSQSESYKAAGVSGYNALQTHVEKRLSHGFQVGFSYTYSHTLDEQSGLGLFYNGNNPLDLKSGYGNSDFDRTHVINFTYVYRLPKFFEESSLKGKFTDGWAFQGATILQSGQPYSIIDYTGAVGSIYYSTTTESRIRSCRWLPVAPRRTLSPARSAITSLSPRSRRPASTCRCSSRATLNGAIPAGDTYETNFVSGGGQRNIFRQSWQKRADLSIVKMTQINGAGEP